MDEEMFASAKTIVRNREGNGVVDLDDYDGERYRHGNTSLNN